MRHATRRWAYRVFPLLGLGLLGLALLPAPHGVQPASWVGTAPRIADASAATSAQASSSNSAPGPQVLRASLVVPKPDGATQPETVVPLKANWSDYLPPGAAAAVASSIPAASTDGAVGNTAVNARSGPSTANPVVFTLAAGESVKIGESSGGWVHVYRPTGGDGWVFGRYLSMPGGGAPADAATPPKTVASTAPAAADNSPYARLIGRTVGIGARVAVRSRPGGAPVMMLEPGDRMQIVDSRGGWLRVVTPDGTSGWVPG